MKVAVFGAGTMGSGIAQVFAAKGHTALMYASSTASAQRHKDKLAASLNKKVAKGKMTQEAADDIMSRVLVEEFDAAADADLVIECVAENMAVKKELLGKLDAICKDETIFASNTSSLSITEMGQGMKHQTGLGITPGFGGTQRLARLVSPGMAKQLIYTAKNIKADEAYRIGLVNAVYPLDELLPAAEKLAETIAKNAPIAVRACKQAINDGLQVDMDKAIVIEEKLFGSCFQSADQIEGMSAFLEKRKHEPYQNK